MTYPHVQQEPSWTLRLCCKQSVIQRINDVKTLKYVNVKPRGVDMVQAFWCCNILILEKENWIAFARLKEEDQTQPVRFWKGILRETYMCRYIGSGRKGV